MCEQTIAALLLLNLGTAPLTFIALANVLNRSLPLSFYAGDQGAQASVCQLVNQTLTTKSPQLHKHIGEHDTIAVEFDSRLAEVFTSLFTRHLSLDDCTRLWDAYVFEGDSVLIHAAVALLLEKEVPLLGAQSAAEFQSVLEGEAKIKLENHDEDAFAQRVRDMGK